MTTSALPSPASAEPSRKPWTLADGNVLKKFIKFPTTQDRAERNKEEFLAIANFPNIVGVIDGTHMGIVAPEEELVYVNRKGYHTLSPSTAWTSVTI